MWLLIWLGIWSIYMVAAVLVCRAAWREMKAEVEAKQAREAPTDTSDVTEDSQLNDRYDVREKPPWFWY
jgi:hypothetical protein